MDNNIKNKYIPSNQLFDTSDLSEISNRIDSNPPIVFADNLKTPENMGAIIRLLANVGCGDIYFIYTDDLQIRESKIKKAAGSSYGKVKHHFIKPSEVSDYIPQNYTKVAIETTESSEMIYNVNLPEKVAFFLGSEKFGMSQDLLDIMDLSVHIPVTGITKSLNVSHCFGICIFEWMRQSFFNKTRKTI
ncbi:MAG: TrmH family RNA methyltransferase [Hyphomicrobiales bacterium]